MSALFFFFLLGLLLSASFPAPIQPLSLDLSLPRKCSLGRACNTTPFPPSIHPSIFSPLLQLLSSPTRFGPRVQAKQPKKKSRLWFLSVIRRTKIHSSSLPLLLFFYLPAYLVRCHIIRMESRLVLCLLFFCCFVELLCSFFFKSSLRFLAYFSAFTFILRIRTDDRLFFAYASSLPSNCIISSFHPFVFDFAPFPLPLNGARFSSFSIHSSKKTLDLALALVFFGVCVFLSFCTFEKTPVFSSFLFACFLVVAGAMLWLFSLSEPMCSIRAVFLSSSVSVYLSSILIAN
jgi:hypothetical protein